MSSFYGWELSPVSGSTFTTCISSGSGGSAIVFFAGKLFCNACVSSALQGGCCLICKYEVVRLDKHAAKSGLRSEHGECATSIISGCHLVKLVHLVQNVIIFHTILVRLSTRHFINDQRTWKCPAGPSVIICYDTRKRERCILTTRLHNL